MSDRLTATVENVARLARIVRDSLEINNAPPDALRHAAICLSPEEWDELKSQPGLGMLHSAGVSISLHGIRITKEVTI